jgi:hypothetical protein
MSTLLLSALVGIRSWFQTRAALQVEILALRHQLTVLKRSHHGRLRLNSPDRLLWVWLSRFWAGWRSALVIVKPETVISWHRKGFRLYWRWKSRNGDPGRPTIDLEVRKLIRRMSQTNPPQVLLRVLPILANTSGVGQGLAGTKGDSIAGARCCDRDP